MFFRRQLGSAVNDFFTPVGWRHVLVSQTRLSRVALLAAILGFVTACTPAGPVEGVAIAATAYPEISPVAGCPTGSKAGPAGATDGMRTAEGIVFNVRTPANYRSDVAHPLLLVFPPAGASAKKSEIFTHLTTEATRRGFVVVYTSHTKLSPEVVPRLAKVPAAVAGRWCIDLKRVYATGHSDGGTASHAIAVLPETRGMLAGIAPSAAGFTRKDLEAYACPAPLPVMIMHNDDDRLFPAWGKETTSWWAVCNRCDINQLPQRDKEGCLVYPGCAAPLSYCEKPGGHSDWPEMNVAIVERLLSAAVATK